MKDNKKEENPTIKAEKPKKVSLKKPKYTFVKKWVTQNKTYNVGDGLYETHKNIVDFLQINRYIK